MADLIKMLSDLGDTILTVVSHLLEQTAAFILSLISIYTGQAQVLTFFPSFLGGIMSASLVLLLLLRLIGR